MQSTFCSSCISCLYSNCAARLSWADFASLRLSCVACCSLLSSCTSKTHNSWVTFKQTYIQHYNCFNAFRHVMFCSWLSLIQNLMFWNTKQVLECHIWKNLLEQFWPHKLDWTSGPLPLPPSLQPLLQLVDHPLGLSPWLPTEMTKSHTEKSSVWWEIRHPSSHYTIQKG